MHISLCYTEFDTNKSAVIIEMRMGHMLILIMLLFLTGLWPIGLILLIRKLSIQKTRRRISNKKIIDSGIILTVAGILLLASGAGGFAGMRQMSGAVMLLGGTSFIVSGLVARNRHRIFKKYNAIIRSRNSISIAEIASTMPASVQTVLRDIQLMIDNGALPEYAYIDARSNRLILSQDDLDIGQDDGHADYIDDVSVEPVQSGYQSVFEEKINQIRAAGQNTANEIVRKKIKKIEVLTSGIFSAVVDNPEKNTSIRKFMNYYLPTTLKLISQYGQLERQIQGGSNITKSMHDIERVLDKLIEGFECQLDNLYSADVIDIKSDIRVLEAMMAADGLSGDDGFKKRNIL